MKKIKSIDITLENCEQYNIPANCVQFMNVRGFTDIITIHWNNTGDYTQYKEAYYFELKVKDSQNIKAHWDFSKPFFERVHGDNDITYINLNYEDGKTFGFYVPWDYNDEQYNSYQKTYIDKDNVMTIKIRRNKKK